MKHSPHIMHIQVNLIKLITLMKILQCKFYRYIATYIHHWMEWCEIIKIKLYNIDYGYLYQLLRYKTFTFLKRLLKFFTTCTGIIIWCSLAYLACMVCQIIDFNKSTLLHIILTTFMHGLSHHMISLVVSTIHSTTVLEDLEIQVHSSPTAFMF